VVAPQVCIHHFWPQRRQNAGRLAFWPEESQNRRWESTKGSAGHAFSTLLKYVSYIGDMLRKCFGGLRWLACGSTGSNVDGLKSGQTLLANAPASKMNKTYVEEGIQLAHKNTRSHLRYFRHSGCSNVGRQLPQLRHSMGSMLASQEA